jgi:glucose-1-phosphatase
MLEAIIFDLGNVFLNLDLDATPKAFKALGLQEWNQELQELHQKYEIGKIEEYDFLCAIQKYIPNVDLLDIREAYNAIIVDFPLERLEFLEKLKNRYQLYLLSNTNATHIDKFEHRVGLTFAREFYACFDKIYFSHETGYAKPHEMAFKQIIIPQNLKPNKTLFVDDMPQNIAMANSLGLQTWQVIVGKEDVTNLLHNKIL